MILLDGVSKTYPGDKVPALDNVSLHVSPNEFVFIVGKSGAGKSTLTKMITKEERQDSGKIVVGGIDLDYVKKRHIPHYRRRLGVVFQDFKLLPRRTVYENVAFALEIAGMSNKEIRNTVPKVLELVGLSDQAKKFPNQLSGGQMQRVSIARSVARQPKILIADEPTANLDQLTTKEIIDLLQKINDFGTTLVVTTHNESIVNHLQKRVITMENGRIISDQKTNGLYRLDPEQIIKKPGSDTELHREKLEPKKVIRTIPVKKQPAPMSKPLKKPVQRMSKSQTVELKPARPAQKPKSAISTPKKSTSYLKEISKQDPLVNKAKKKVI